jgi:beta-aspartyl-peptidase (threonine type)
MIAAMDLLRKGATALDAVEVAARITEADVDDASVGRGGLPNILGEVELDAGMMDGRTLRAGAVAAVQGYGHPISLARAVMEQLPHVLLAGRGAERFAAEVGLQPEDQRIAATMARWRERFGQFGLDPNALTNLAEAATTLTRPLDLDHHLYHPTLAAPAAEAESLPEPPRDDTKGTVNFLALDGNGDMAAAVSTSGIAWKYPGRVGDSPIVGAGLYCDNRYGAAACTGMGELALRASTARSLILYMKMGMSLSDAGLETLRDLEALDGALGYYMNIVALSPAGEHAGFTTIPGKRYLYMTAEMDEPAAAARLPLRAPSNAQPSARLQP